MLTGGRSWHRNWQHASPPGHSGRVVTVTCHLHAEPASLRQAMPRHPSIANTPSDRVVNHVTSRKVPGSPNRRGQSGRRMQGGPHADRCSDSVCWPGYSSKSGAGCNRVCFFLTMGGRAELAIPGWLQSAACLGYYGQAPRRQDPVRCAPEAYVVVTGVRRVDRRDPPCHQSAPVQDHLDGGSVPLEAARPPCRPKSLVASGG